MRVTRFQFVIACLLIFSVAVICIAPSVDLAPTTLGSQQAASVAMAALVAASTTLTAVLVPLWASLHGWSLESEPEHFSSLLDLNCSRLC